jgi:hypothetical protein
MLTLDRVEVPVSPLRSQDLIVAEINALGAKAKQASDKADQYRATRRQNISELHKRWPDEWLQIVKEQCKIDRREAYKQVAIADGRTTEEKEREKDAAAKRRQRSAGHPALNTTENIEECEDAEDEPGHMASATVSAQASVGALTSRRRRKIPQPLSIVSISMIGIALMRKRRWRMRSWGVPKRRGRPLITRRASSLRACSKRRGLLRLPGRH